MKRIAIITLVGFFNYGNRLQNYAVYKVLKNLGYESISFTFRKCKFEVERSILLKWKFHEATEYLFKKKRGTWKVKKGRQLAFEYFTHKYIPTEQVYSLEELQEKADVFVLGSDQVWNPTWYCDYDKDFYLLTFAKPEQKICFSPSFGLEKLPDEWVPWFSEKLREFTDISVREQAGAKIIRELIGREAQVLLDPTMLLDKNEWMKIARRPRNVKTNRPYVLTYFLGKRPVQADTDIKNIQNTQNIQVYNLLDKGQPDIYASGPSEFIYLISRASIVLTDSFHACVFSFIFNRPFLVYERTGGPEMGSRITTLLQVLSLERKNRSNNMQTNFFECNYEKGYEALENMREKTIKYLAEELNKKERVLDQSETNRE